MANTNYTENSVDISSKYAPSTVILDGYSGIPSTLRTSILYGVGSNQNGQLGINSAGSGSTSFTPLYTAAQDWRAAIASGRHMHGCIKPNGSLWVWGYNHLGQLGDGTITARSLPTQIGTVNIWKQVSFGGNYNSAAVRADGTLWLWGDNSYGEIGDNTITNKSSPVQTIAAGTAWETVACGNGHTIALKNDGTLWSWGNNTYGQLGDNTVAHKSSPVQISHPTSLKWEYIKAGSFSTFAIDTAGVLWGWGFNSKGELGIGTNSHTSTPVQIISDSIITSIGGSGRATFIVKSNGTLWGWGFNDTYATLGDGTLVSKSSPIQIGTSTNWYRVASYSDSDLANVAIKVDGTIWGWGNNQSYQLAPDLDTYKSTPIQIGSGYKWKQVSCNGTTIIGLAELRGY